MRLLLLICFVVFVGMSSAYPSDRSPELGRAGVNNMRVKRGAEDSYGGVAEAMIAADHSNAARTYSDSSYVGNTAEYTGPWDDMVAAKKWKSQKTAT